MHPSKRAFILLVVILALISGGLLMWRFGVTFDAGRFFAAENSDGVDPQYIFVRKSNTCSNCILWNGHYPENYSAAAINEIVTLIGTKGTPTRRLGVGAIFEPNQIDIARTKQSLVNLLHASLENEFPVFLSLDNFTWWDNRPNLWYWWEPGISATEKAARKANVEWSDWDGDTNDANALKISWTNWGSQFRRPPGPNLLSPAYIENSISNLNQLLPVITEWYRQLPANKKYLLGGVDFGNEVDIGANFYYYQNGNSYASEDPTSSLNTDPASDPHYPTSDFLAHTTQIGYAALKLGGIKSSGTITTEDLNAAVNRYLNILTKHAYNAGIPRNKIFNHTGGKGSSPDWIYPTTPAFTDLRSTLMPYAYPGWSLYGNKTNPVNSAILNSALDSVPGMQWASPEWLPDATDAAEWLSAVRSTLNYRNNRFINVANWEEIRSNSNALSAIRTALGESPACWVSSPTVSVAATGNSAVFTLSGGQHAPAQYLNIATNSTLRSDGIFQTADITNDNIVGKSSYTVPNLTPGVYHWLLASDGCSPVQRRVAYGTFEITASQALRGDLNSDGIVNAADLSRLVTIFGRTSDLGGADLIPGNGVDIFDYNELVRILNQ